MAGVAVQAAATVGDARHPALALLRRTAGSSLREFAVDVAHAEHAAGRVQNEDAVAPRPAVRGERLTRWNTHAVDLGLAEREAIAALGSRTLRRCDAQLAADQIGARVRRERHGRAQ